MGKLCVLGNGAVLLVFFVSTLAQGLKAMNELQQILALRSGVSITHERSEPDALPRQG